MGEENNENVQNSPDNPGPSTMEIQPKTYNKTSTLETQNSLMEYASAEVIDIPDCDNNKDYYYYSDISDLNILVPIIGTVKAVVNNTAILSPLFCKFVSR